jgi:hypothetical protein
MADFWLAELDDELHECHLPRHRWGRIYACECGCVWEAILSGVPGLLGLQERWTLARDPGGA